MPSTVNIALFASGAGSNVQNIIRYFNAHPHIRVKLVVTNNSGCGAVQIAHNAGIETLCMQKHEISNGEWLVQELKTRHIHFIALAGYLKMVPPALAAAYHRQMVNVHPALLPKFGGKGMYGRHVHTAVKAAGESETGITIHYVTEVYDEGEIIVQKKTTVDAADTVENIETKVRELEMQWFPVTIESVILQKTPL